MPSLGGHAISDIASVRIEILLEEAHKCINQLKQVTEAEFAMLDAAIKFPDNVSGGDIEDVSKENVRYIEVRYSPILHTKNGMTLEDAIISVRNGLEKGKKDFGVK